MCVSTGPRRLALLGCATAHPGVLEARLGRVRSLADLDEIARLPAGSFHLVASLDGDVRVQGTLSTACQVFLRPRRRRDAWRPPRRQPGRTHRCRASTRNAWHSNCCPRSGPPEPLSEGSVWRGVRSPRIGHCLEISRDGAGRTRRWWTPPEPERPWATAGSSARRCSTPWRREPRTRRS
ncbi:hypothetical protein LV779_27160 [Streptomyces thinghirensis]|nr:hypothetical protein [Streptomyces thinghirensis]